MLSTQEEEFVIRGQLKKSDGTKISYDAILLPNRLYKVDEQHFGEATIRCVQKVNESTYSIELVTDRITPLVWLQLLNSDGVQAHWFSDNAFTMTEPTKTVWLYLIKFDSKRPSIGFDDIRVCSLRNCGLQTFD
ncbi:unnamed protein product [Anisakis simplex]|uniref:Beta-mannosidase n=1 Tax=Anisakis simplex TaxID=6269 RepID=A0A0M3J448_ANISI|nr:unnamed protein product [Anisakis simplex]